MMKLYSTIMMLALMVAALGFASCGGDDDEVDNGGGEASIVGVWECTSFEYDTDYPEMIGNHIDVGDIIRLESNGKSYSNLHNGTWEQKGNKLYVLSDGQYSVPAEYTIEKLTANEMILSMDLMVVKVRFKFKRVS